MTQKSRQAIDLDRDAYESADAALRLVSERLPEDRIAGLAREVVRRLAFRMPGNRITSDQPTAAEIDRFCTALMASDGRAANQIILRAKRDGANVHGLYLGYIAGASRRLGAMWEADELSFMDVSLGTGRLYRIVRGLRHAIAPVLLEGRTHMPALFVLTPGETHTLGVEIAADLFRRDGGDVDVCIGMSHDEVLALADERHYGAVVLVANSDSVIEPLLRIGLALRISQPLTPFALAGNVVDEMPEVQQMVGAEMVISDIQAGILELRKLTKHK